MFDSAADAEAAASSERYIVAKSEGDALAKAHAQYGEGVVLKQETGARRVATCLLASWLAGWLRVQGAGARAGR